MGKLDFCFTYYDGDAAKDKAHMDRLQRGGYDDIISAQRKRGHLSLEDLERVLGRDFEYCMKALTGWVMAQDENGLYYIPWVDKSIAKDLAYKSRQSERANKRWSKEKTDLEQPEKANDSAQQSLPVTWDGSGTTHNQLVDIDLMKEKVFLDKMNFVRVYTGWGLKEDVVYNWLQAFNKFLAYQGVQQKTEKDYRTHFGNWLNRQEYHKADPNNYQPVTKNAHGKEYKGNTSIGKPVPQIVSTGNRGQL